MRALLVADDCNPEWPSLPVVGYETCKAIAEIVDAVVVTQVRNRPNIEKSGFGKHGCGRADVVYVDNEYIARPIHRLSTLVRRGGSTGWTMNVALNYPAYLGFEREVWKRFRGELRQGAFDIVHRVTPMSPTLPSPLARWSPAPFVLGPLNGGLQWPAAYHGELRREREWMTYLRSAYRCLPYYRSTYRRAAAILAAFPHTIADLPEAVRESAIDFPEVGFDPCKFYYSERQPAAAMTFLFAGRLVPYKCPDVVVEAMARRPELRRHRLLIVGEGPERPALEAAIDRHGLRDCVTLLGWKSQQEVGRLLRSADVFVFPSIRELGAGVVVEAMACGMACLVVDYGGPAGLIQEGLGWKVPLCAKEEMIERFAATMEQLASDPDKVRATGRSASEFAHREYSWASKAGKFLDVYRWTLEPQRPRPAFLR